MKAPQKDSLNRWIDPESREQRDLARHPFLEDDASLRIVRMGVLCTAVVVLVFFAWSAVARVDETTVAVGEVIPSAKLQSVQHLEGGIITDLLVEEGSLVEPGQVIARLDPTSASALLGQKLSKKASLELSEESLRAILEQRQPAFQEIAGDQPELVRDQQVAFSARLEAQNSERAILELQVQQRRSELHSLRDQRASAGREVALLQEKADMWAELESREVAARVQVIDARQALQDVRGEFKALRGREVTTAEALTEYETRLSDLYLRQKQQATQELGAVTAELDELNKIMAQSQDRVARLEVIAPVRGIVQNLPLETAGGVLPPGGLVAEIVPIDDLLVVEAEVSAADIGFVSEGQAARVKFDTYNFARYGVIEGKLESLSPTAFQRENGPPYYRALISLASPHVGQDPKRNLVLPGMTVQADIITGNKSILQYMLKPIYTNLDQSFRER